MNLVESGFFDMLFQERHVNNSGRSIRRMKSFLLFLSHMEDPKFIDIRRLIESKNPALAKWLPGFVINYLKRILHQDEINAFLVNNKDVYDGDFCSAVIEYFNITIEIEGIENIPTSGPAIISMNHPLGGMDALAFISAMKNHREDLRFIVNDLLMNLHNLKNLFVGVNKHGKNELSTRQQISDLFESDEAVCIFPAGLVSRRVNGKVRDLDWKKTFITYSVKFNQPIIPVFIDGELSNFFYRLANFRKAIGIKANLEMLYLADELFKQRNKTIRFAIGKPIWPSELDLSKSERELAKEVKQKVYELSEKH
jgi:putative hemolysin